MNFKVKRATKKDKRTEKYKKFGKYNKKSIRIRQEADQKAKEKRIIKEKK